MPEALSWDEMLRMFRLLGGTAENITSGGSGRGLMAMDSEHPVHVHVPTSLLFNVQDVEFADDQLRLRKNANSADAERLFFDGYQEGFSWGASGRSEGLSFVEWFDALPDDVRSLLAGEFGFEYLMEGDAIERAEKWFLKSRSMQLGDSYYLAPVLELANYGAGGLTWYYERGLNIHGAVTNEVAVTYGAYDSFSAFRVFGLVTREPGAFSQRTEVLLGDRRISILQDTPPVEDARIAVPTLEFEVGVGNLPFLMLGHRRMPKASRGIFRNIAAKARIEKPDEVFDTVMQFNWAIFLKLLDVLTPYDGDAVVKLRTVVRYQLEAMSCCFGSSEGEKEPAQEELWSISIS